MSDQPSNMAATMSNIWLWKPFHHGNPPKNHKPLSLSLRPPSLSRPPTLAHPHLPTWLEQFENVRVNCSTSIASTTTAAAILPSWWNVCSVWQTTFCGDSGWVRKGRESGSPDTFSDSYLHDLYLKKILPHLPQKGLGFCGPNLAHFRSKKGIDPQYNFYPDMISEIRPKFARWCWEFKTTLSSGQPN